MHNSGFLIHARRSAPLQEWSPTVHYAQFQKMAPCLLPERRLYDFELLYVRKGEARTHFREYTVDILPGQLLFIPPGVHHHNEVVGAPHTQFIGIHFDFLGEMRIQRDDDMVVQEQRIMREKFGIEAVAEGFEPLSSQLLYTPSPLCVQLMEQLVHEYTMRPPGYMLICKGLMLHILGLLLRSQKEYTSLKPPVHGDRIQELMMDMEAEPAAVWSNPQLAERLNMNEDHMIKMFRRMAGMPPGEYVQMLRLREARRLLRETDSTIEDIGRQVGYGDIHYFSRLFRKVEGMPPRTYRRIARIL